MLILGENLAGVLTAVFTRSLVWLIILQPTLLVKLGSLQSNSMTVIEMY